MFHPDGGLQPLGAVSFFSEIDAFLAHDIL